MTDAITFLTNDHRAIDALFKQVEGSTSPSKDVVNEIVKTLSQHDAIEKEYLYPTLRDDRIVNGGNLADHAVEEHNEQAADLLKIDKADDGSQEQAALLQELISEVRHHVEEEESTIFGALRSVLSAEELEELGSKLEAAKKTAPTRPHPMAPSEGLGTKLAGAMAAPIDKLRDRAEGR